jgi:hypothetical protein
MDLLEERAKSDLDDKVKRLLRILKFKSFPIILKGSAALQSQQYFSDYDLMTVIDPKPSVDVAYHQFGKILNQVLAEDDVWITELKIQTLSGKKIRFAPRQVFTYKRLAAVWSDIDFVKIDLIIRASDRITELSCIYKFGATASKPEEYLKMLRTDIEDLTKAREWYKILKRQFSIAKIERKPALMRRLTAVFNGPLGAKYQQISNLEAIALLLSYYDDTLTRRKAELNLKDIKHRGRIEDVARDAKAMRADLNAEAKKVYAAL